MAASACLIGVSRKGLIVLLFWSLLIPIAMYLNTTAWYDACSGVGLGSDPNIEEMEQKADLIIAGRAYRIGYIPFSDGKGLFLLSPDHLLKGGSLNLLDRYPRMLILTAFPNGNQNDGTFFLKTVGTNCYASVDEHFAALNSSTIDWQKTKNASLP